MRKVMSLVLALIMVVSVFPFAAFADDGVESYVIVTRCDSCGGNVPKIPVSYINEKYKELYDPFISWHEHHYYGDFDVYTCGNCGKKFIHLIQHRGIHCTTWPHCLGEIPE